MSSPDALATVTATLRHLLSGAAATVSTKPPSIARQGENGEQINIFLYSTHYNSAFSNFPMPGEARSGENAYPPLPLVLKYLITAYGANDDDISGQQLMGRAMSILHDRPLLGRVDIEGITPDSGLHRQIERVRITPDTLSLDDMSKLWSSFQSAEYRLSTGYQVSVVLIESTRIKSAPLPVLKRGEQDQGTDVTAAPSPSISGLRFPNQKPAAEFGDLITILGENLAGDNIVIRFQHLLLVHSMDPSIPKPIDLLPESGRTDTEITVKLPDQADDAPVGSKWPAGFYSVSLLIKRPNMPAWTSNALSMPLSPKIKLVDPDPPSAPAGNVELTIECLPQILPDQRVLLLFGDRTIKPDAVSTPANPSAASTLTFTVEKAKARAIPYVVRLRIDGVDSIPVDFSGDTPQFADNQQVNIT
ncbi:DUF4255 domain-containing protein [Nitrosomonas sp. Nm166]|uniref:DUF4255 domain-containing protein n=1 Tax=Nitrosomonas sp. Nm166 TaxID=1881054 RepID=UPI0008E719D9|nr:DUF4255 domain-containing protein [Nitrosomonas sp. Nm166]SFE85600.1 Protein of unknown function [Nitrosomonas sp. Nm166]